jgi:hypothetical protein
MLDTFRYPSIKSSVWIKEFRNELHVGDLYANSHLVERHFDVANWLNGGTGRIGWFIGFLNRVFEVVLSAERKRVRGK